MKKKIAMLALLSAALLSHPGAFAQSKTFSIKGQVPEMLNGRTIYLIKATGKKKIPTAVDSALIAHGAFDIVGEADQPFAATLSAPVRNPGIPAIAGFREVFINAGDHISFIQPQVINPKNTLEGAQVNHSEYTRQWDELTAYLLPADAPMDSMRKISYEKRLAKNTDTSGYYAMAVKFNELMAQKVQLQESFIALHPSYYISLYLFRDMLGARIDDTQKAKATFAKLAPSLRKLPLGEEIVQLIANSAHLEVNKMAPDFAAQTPEGKILKLSDLRGKYVLLDFWASWCGPCRAENPNVVKAYQQYKDKNFDVLGVSLDKEGDKQKWIDAIAKDGLTWHHVSDLKFWNSGIAKQYMIASIPQNFLLDPNGKIIAVNLRGAALEEMLKKILQ
ncbi:redoxin domain-containing protein [Chitinophaga sp. RAB17]|uniref:redoxin domain-containing protein n=1 Tax=Chitinophaga sp. RAB17 TaxID=3233049 RepID=UPI003F8E3F46